MCIRDSSISSAKTDFVVVGETAQNVDYNGSGDKLLSAYASELLATLTVKNANGGDLTASDDYTIAVVADTYTGPNGKATGNETIAQQAETTWTVQYACLLYTSTVKNAARFLRGSRRARHPAPRPMM